MIFNLFRSNTLYANVNVMLYVNIFSHIYWLIILLIYIRFVLVLHHNDYITDCVTFIKWWKKSISMRKFFHFSIIRSPSPRNKYFTPVYFCIFVYYVSNERILCFPLWWMMNLRVYKISMKKENIKISSKQNDKNHFNVKGMCNVQREQDWDRG